MTEQEIQDYNRLCAEFLGWEYIDKNLHPQAYENYGWWVKGTYENDADPRNNPNWKGFNSTLKFHSDWNWIMEVVEAIEALKLGNVKIPVTFSSMHQPMKTEIQEYYDASIVFNINYSNCVVDVVGTMRLFEGFIVVDNLLNKKEAVVQAIYQFLIWYINESSNKNNQRK